VLAVTEARRWFPTSAIDADRGHQRTANRFGVSPAQCSRQLASTSSTAFRRRSSAQCIT
jgi:hypothetical protein